ncbi:glycoside hydrolase family 32 protein [Brenneria goodwinii]|uniref:glycoside hydrolase family 32 protein n=1 Tax=Brenneria goodwinii TaxID=1109412 RepID=UPI0036EB263C
MREKHLLKQTLLAVMKGHQRTPSDHHRPLWHLSPVVGLMNDPNGFIQFQQRYHLFYQWNPLACNHNTKFWGHWSSADLVNWQHEPVALLPSEEFDIDGCFSGSAVDDNGQLVLIYTGNVMLADDDRTAWQCIARQNAQGEFEKQPVLGQPEGYTGHVRDPKVWRHDDSWYMVLAAQDPQLQGKVLLLKSPDLVKWTLMGEIAGSKVRNSGEFGYMWECPDLFHLDGHDVLITCPQGVAAEERRYLNQYQCGYLLGKLDYATGDYPHGPFHELDSGHEFYAPQTTLTDDGRRLLIGWMGVPDQDEFEQPTLQHGWVHMMTCPRELSVRAGRLCQKPARELQALRAAHRQAGGRADSLPTLDAHSAEIALQVSGNFQANFGATMWLTCDEQGITLSRKGLRNGEEEKRYWQGKVEKLQILCDSSSLEIFINDGVGVMSSRYFPTARAEVTFSGSAEIALNHWQLKESQTGAPLADLDR